MKTFRLLVAILTGLLYVISAKAESTLQLIGFMEKK